VEKILKKVTTGRKNWETLVSPRMLERKTYVSKSVGRVKPAIDYDSWYIQGKFSERDF
jgi:hypothetical protein